MRCKETFFSPPPFFFLSPRFFLCSPPKAENKLISSGGTNGSILVGNSFLSQKHLEIRRRKSDKVVGLRCGCNMGCIVTKGKLRFNLRCQRCRKTDGGATIPHNFVLEIEEEIKQKKKINYLSATIKRQSVSKVEISFFVLVKPFSAFEQHPSPTQAEERSNQSGAS